MRNLLEELRKLAEAKKPQTGLYKKKPRGPSRNPTVKEFDELADRIERLASDVEDEPYTFDHGEVLEVVDAAMDILADDEHVADHYDAIKHQSQQLKDAVTEADKLQNKLKQAASDVADALRLLANEFPSD